jgi:methylmalonyl-CoA mutase N-terminal domain/subunit
MATEASQQHSASLRPSPPGDPYQGHRNFRTLSGLPVKEVYTSQDVPAAPAESPGVYPYTRGIHPTMYRGRFWAMRQFAGFGTPRETNMRS